MDMILVWLLELLFGLLGCGSWLYIIEGEMEMMNCLLEKDIFSHAHY